MSMDAAIDFARAGLLSDQHFCKKVSPQRLARHFTKTSKGFQVCPELRGLIVFTVQDLLVDPPFARLDLISCRNVLIYLGPDAQKRLLGLFHFALSPDGLLLLGSSRNGRRRQLRFHSPVQKAGAAFPEEWETHTSVRGIHDQG